MNGEGVMCKRCKQDTSETFEGMCLRCAVRSLLSRIAELEADLCYRETVAMERSERE